LSGSRNGCPAHASFTHHHHQCNAVDAGSLTRLVTAVLGRCRRLRALVLPTQRTARSAAADVPETVGIAALVNYMNAQLPGVPYFPPALARVEVSMAGLAAAPDEAAEAAARVFHHLLGTLEEATFHRPGETAVLVAAMRSRRAAGLPVAPKLRCVGV
jgi:hypothetical protein